jgi:site-specific DNA recombinase
MHVAIYARYSSDLQSATSIEDQVRVCRARADREGWTVEEVYDDPAISGAHIQNRPSVQRLLSDAKSGRFNMVLTEALDRLSRDQEHISWLYKRLSSLDVPVFTLAEGHIDELHIGFKGTMNAVFLKDLAAKVRRGQRGQIERGRAAGGLPYGYRVERRFGPDGHPETGLREIDEAQAAIVRRIFADYVAGMSPRMIAERLNAEGVPGPRGGRWNQSTINGARGRGRGILHNAIYVGRMIYGRASFRKDPDTGRRREVKTAPTEWLAKDAPALRIVDDDTWRRAQELKAVHSAMPPTKAKRPKRLLSGLVFCGCCGSPYIVIDKREALLGLRRHLLAPEAISTFIGEYHRLMKEDRAAQSREKRLRDRKLSDLDAKIGRMVSAIADGIDTPALRKELIKLEGERAKLAMLKADDENSVIDLSPDLPDFYRRQVETLAEQVMAPDLLPRAAAILRDLIDRLVLHPGPGRGEFQLELRGHLAGLIRFATGRPAGRSALVPDRGVMLAERGGFGRSPYAGLLITLILCSKKSRPS